MAVAAAETRTVYKLEQSWLVRLFDNKTFLICLCLFSPRRPCCSSS